MSSRILVLPYFLFACTFVNPLHAEPYWVAWEGNEYPENEGWLREGTGERASRSLNEGIMTLDSLANMNGQDFYSIYDTTDPGPSEEFIVQWRVRVNEVVWDNPNFPYDPGWSINSADGAYASFVLGLNEFQNLPEQAEVSFEPAAFHEWEFRSADMRTYAISLDGMHVMSGMFVAGLPRAHIGWGDYVWGPTSNVEWDYFRFGVVPEPNSGLLLLTVAFACIPRRTL